MEGQGHPPDEHRSAQTPVDRALCTSMLGGRVFVFGFRRETKSKTKDSL